VDASWHGHLSLMRGVENGFAMVRDARVGLLNISDDRGQILAEQSTRSDGALTTMLATVPVRHDPTIYQKAGDWFAATITLNPDYPDTAPALAPTQARSGEHDLISAQLSAMHTRSK